MTNQPLEESSLALPRRRYQQPELRVVAFKMAGQEYVVDVAQVQEIIRPTALLRVAGMPEQVEGLVKRRGRIVPIVDLRKRLHLPVGEPTPESCILISPLSIGPVGFLVDSASELMWVKTNTFEVPSSLLARADQGYVQGVAHLGERVLVMLDLEHLLSPTEQHLLVMGEERLDG
ncbi:MAG: purine-binding chemotaxis protein CheW [Ardenticatenales bacterium]|nr:purine-binding chemotaxis protein CheW [Ardenticatenales bacterium]